MFDKAALLWIYATNPIHAGSGPGVGAIDLPIQRERVTSWPIIHAGGLKGALREHFGRLPASGSPNGDPDFRDKIIEVFGPEDATHSGAMSPTDAMTLLFPVRSMIGTFAYVTCPLALQRFRRHLEILKTCGGIDLLAPGENGRPAFPDLEGIGPSLDKVLLGTSRSSDQPGIPPGIASNLVIDGTLKVGFEEFTFDAIGSQKVNLLADWLGQTAGSLPWLTSPTTISNRMAIVHDDVFEDFIERSTEVITRNRIDDNTGTVADSALWTEEQLPRETVLYATLFATTPFKQAPKLSNGDRVIAFMAGACPDYIWVGGDTTVGKGLVRLSMIWR